MDRSPGIVVANLRLLEQGLELIGALPDEAFAGDGRAGKAVGTHFRHVLEPYSCFLEGLAGARIDYDARPPEVAIETDREAARGRIR